MKLFKLSAVLLASALAATAAKAQETRGEVEDIEYDDDPSVVLSLAGLVNNTAERVAADREEDDPAYGAAVLIETNIRDRVGLEAGVMYLQRQYEIERGAARVITEVERLHVPLLARMWLTDYFSLGVGPFAEFAIDDEETVLELGGQPVGSIETSASEDVVFGFDVAATLNLAVADKSGLFLEGRYTAPLDEEDDEDINEITGLVGLKFDM